MRLALAGLVGLVATVAMAAEQQPPPIAVPNGLAVAIHSYLINGGTRMEADRLAVDLYEAALAPTKEADLRKRIEAELKAQAAPLLPDPSSKPK